MKFALSFTNSNVVDLDEHTFETVINEKNNNNWFISYCLPTDENDDFEAENNCLDDLVLKKLSIMLNGLVKIGTVNCNYEKNLCKRLKPTCPNVFYKELNEETIEFLKIESSSYKDIAQRLLSFLPDVNLLDINKFEVGFA
jgi:hypothetical protein